MEEKEQSRIVPKKSGIGLAVRIFLLIVALLSVILFANRLMEYNRLQKEREQLLQKQKVCEELVAELREEVAISDRLRELLDEYLIYGRLSGKNDLGAYELQLLAEVRSMLEDPDTREYIIKIARENGLAFPNEILYYTDLD